jgi:hypothetical protein
MATHKTQKFTELRARVNAWVAAKAKAREATNALNKESTKLKNTFKAWLEEAKLPPATKLELEDGRYSYTASVTETVDPRGWYKLWQDGEITEEQFFDCLKVGKAPAEAAAGADQLATITTSIPGKKRDIRFEELDRVEGRELVILPETAAKTGVARRSPPTVQPSASPVPKVSPAGGLRKLRIPTHGR